MTNQERANKIRNGIAMLSSMVDSGKCHSIQSREVVRMTKEYIDRQEQRIDELEKKAN